MGIFDVFKSKAKDFGTLHCLNTREWHNGYETDTKGLVEFVKKQTKNKSESQFIDYLKKRPEYRKFEDKNISDTLNKITCTKHNNNEDDVILPKINYFIYPKNFVDEHCKQVCAFRILETKTAMEGEKIKTGNFKILVKMEYNHLKPFEKMYINTEGDKYAKAWDKGDMYNAIFGDEGIFATKKRKKYPINYFQAFLAFEE